MPTEESSGDLKAKKYGSSQDSGLRGEDIRWGTRLSRELTSHSVSPEIRALVVKEMDRLKKENPQVFQDLSDKMADFALRPKNDKLSIVEEVLKELKLKK